MLLRICGATLAASCCVPMLDAAALAPSLRLDAQTAYPARSIRLVVPFPPGASTDTIARIIAERIEEGLARKITIENRSGAGGNVGAEAVVRAPADGHTWLLGTAGMLTINPLIYPAMSFDPAFAFEPVTLVARIPYVLTVHPSIPVRSVPSLIEFVRRRPWILNYGSAGNGSTIHLGTELFKAMTDTRIVHIPYRGGAPAVSELIGGHIHLMFLSMPLALQYADSGRLRFLALSSEKRSAAFPELPTLHEAGVTDFEFTGWFALLVPARTSPRIIVWLNHELVAMLAGREVRQRLEAIGAQLETSTPVQVHELMRRDAARWRRVIQAANVKPDWEDYPQ